MGKADRIVRPGGLAYKILIWSFERGTLPYDIICALILAFVFIVPRSCFLQKKFTQPAAPAQMQESSPSPGGISVQGDTQRRKK
jgi:hypothetical protein